MSWLLCLGLRLRRFLARIPSSKLDGNIGRTQDDPASPPLAGSSSDRILRRSACLGAAWSSRTSIRLVMFRWRRTNRVGSGSSSGVCMSRSLALSWLATSAGPPRVAFVVLKLARVIISILSRSAERSSAIFCFSACSDSSSCGRPPTLEKW